MAEKYEKLVEVISGLEKESRIAVELHRGPDLDSLATGLVLHEILVKKDLVPVITYSGSIGHHPENKLMVSKLAIPLKNYNDQDKPDDYDYFVFVDHSGSTSQWYQNEKIDPRKIICIVDHHEEDSPPKSRFTDIRLVGAASSIIAEYLSQGASELFDEEELERIATGLFLGIRSDTRYLTRKATDFDARMHQYLYPNVDMDLVHSVETPKWSGKWMDCYGRAINTRETQKGITIACVGHIDEDNRGIIPQTADKLMEEEGVHTVYVIGIREDIYDVSIRTDNPTFDFDTLVKLFPEVPEKGLGGKEGSGGMQIPSQFTGGSFIRAHDPESRRKIEELVMMTFKNKLFSS